MAKTIAYNLSITGTDSGYDSSTTTAIFLEYNKTGISGPFSSRLNFTIATGAPAVVVPVPEYVTAAASPVEVFATIRYTDGSTSQYCEVEANATAVGTCQYIWAIRTDEPTISIENKSSDTIYVEMLIRKI